RPRPPLSTPAVRSSSSPSSSSGTAAALGRLAKEHPEQAEVTQRIAEDLGERIAVLLDLGVLLGDLMPEMSASRASTTAQSYACEKRAHFGPISGTRYAIPHANLLARRIAYRVPEIIHVHERRHR